MKSVFIASIETRHFTFEGFGETRDESIGALESAWNEHAVQAARNGMEVPNFKEALDEFDMNVRECVLGQGYRDAEPVGQAFRTRPLPF